MSDSIYLNKIKLDLYEEPISRRLQIGDVGEVSARKSSFSYTIRIPRTSKNIQTLEMLGVIGNISRKPFEEVVCDYVSDNIFIVSNGLAIIKASSGDYELNIIDGFRGLANLLSGKKLIDINWSDLDHVLSAQEYIDTYANTEGLIYCIADYGLGASTTSLKVEKQAPCLYTHTIFKRIFEGVGLVLSGDFFTTNAVYLSEVVTPAKGYSIEDLTTEAAKGGADTDTLSDIDFPVVYTAIDEQFTFTDVGLVGASVVAGDIVFSVAGSYRLEIESSYDKTDTDLSLDFKIDGDSKVLIPLPDGEAATKVDSVIFSVAVGETVSLHIVGGSGIVGSTFNIDYIINCDTLLYLRSGGQTIEVSDFIGEMNQIDFIKDVANRYGLVIHPMQNSINFKFEQIEDVLNDRATAEDWTSKLSLIVRENNSSDYAKINKAVYKYPAEIVIPNNDGEMLIDNENATDEAEMFSSLFTIPNEAGSLSSETIYNIPIWEETTEAAEVEREIIHNTEVGANYLKTDGTLFASAGWVVRKYKNIDPTKTYTISGRVEAADNALICYYDINDVFISFQIFGTGSIVDFVKEPCIIPTNCTIIRANGDTSNKPTLFKTDEEDTVVVENKETPLKIMHIKRKNTTVNARLFDEATAVTDTTDIPFINLDSMSMQDFLDANYLSFQDLIEDFKEKDFLFNLSPIDIYNIDFFKLKFLKQTGKYYYMGSILTTSGELSKVLMFEITNFN